MAGQWIINLTETARGIGTGTAQWWEVAADAGVTAPDFAWTRAGLGASNDQRNAFLSDLVVKRDEWQALEARRATAYALALSWTTVLNANDPKAGA